MALCADSSCVAVIPDDQEFCDVHKDAVMAWTIAKDLGLCGRCRRKITSHEFVSRTMHQTKHKKTGNTSFSWKHASCEPTPRKPSKAARKKAPKPLFDLPEAV